MLVELRGGELRVRVGVFILRCGQVLGHCRVAVDLLELWRGVVHFVFWCNRVLKLHRGDLRAVGWVRGVLGLRRRHRGISIWRLGVRFLLHAREILCGVGKCVHDMPRG